MASNSVSLSRDPRAERNHVPTQQAQPSVSSPATTIEDPGMDNAVEADDRGAFEPELENHLEHPNGGFYAGSRKDFPLPPSRYPLARGSVQRLLEPEPGTAGGRQRHYLDDPSHPLQGYWTQSGTWVDWPPKSSATQPEEDATSHNDSRPRRSSDAPPNHSMTVSATVGTRRQANGTIGSVYSGNKIRHLKKEDGIPLWRKD